MCLLQLVKEDGKIEETEIDFFPLFFSYDKYYRGENVKMNRQRKGLALIATIVIILVAISIAAITGAIIYTEFTKPIIYSSNPYMNEKLTRLWNDVHTDKTDQYQYSSSYQCVNFAKDLDAYLDGRGWESYEVWAYPRKGTTYDYFGSGQQSSEGHAVVGVFVYDEQGKKYLIMIEPQDDSETFNNFDANKDGFISYQIEGGKYSMDNNGLHGWDEQTTTEGNLFLIFGET